MSIINYVSIQFNKVVFSSFLLSIVVFCTKGLMDVDLSVAVHFYLKFLSNLILNLKDRFDKVKDHKLSTL
jgi:hypothetical protein